MRIIKLENKSEIELLRLHASITEELITRGVIRTRNNPCSDYAEWLVQQKLGMLLEHNSRAGFDAFKRGKRYQIKSRRYNPSANSRQLSVIRNLHGEEFDYLIAVIFDEDYSVVDAYQIPHSILKSLAGTPDVRYSRHQNGHIVNLRKGFLEQRGIRNITTQLQDD